MQSKIRDIQTEFETGAVEAAKTLRAGGLIIAPTDTLYGILCSALRPDAVQRVFALKGRATYSPLPLIAADVEQVRLFAEMGWVARVFAECFWPGPLTLVLPAQPQTPAHLLAADGTLAVRVPAHDFCRALAKRVDSLLTATSANFSGEPPATKISEIPRALLEKVDFVFDGGAAVNEKPSTILKITDQKIELLRVGQIALAEIENRLGGRLREE